MDGYLNVKQVSNELQEPEETIRRWLRTGELAGTKHGNHWYVHPKDNEG